MQNGGSLLGHDCVNFISGGNGEIDVEGNFRLRKDQTMKDLDPTSLNNAKINKIPVGIIISKYHNSTSLKLTTDMFR